MLISLDLSNIAKKKNENTKTVVLDLLNLKFSFVVAFLGEAGPTIS